MSRSVEEPSSPAYQAVITVLRTPKAMTATAHKIARMYYNLMRYGKEYVEIGEKAYEERHRRRQIAWLTKKMENLGYAVTPLAA